jgi:hypothetical protein
MALFTWLSRITPPEANAGKENLYEPQLSGDWNQASDAVKDLFALQCDPLTRFAMVFAGKWFCSGGHDATVSSKRDTHSFRFLTTSLPQSINP